MNNSHKKLVENDSKNYSSRTILISITKSFKTAKQISFDCGISITTVYRKLKLLDENNWIEKSGKITRHGKIKYFKKRSEIDVQKIPLIEAGLS